MLMLYFGHMGIMSTFRDELTQRKPAKRSAAARGFTIIELLIVVVIIAILAAITIVAFNGVQDRARDTRIRAAAADIEKAVRRFALETGKQPYSGYGSTGPVNDLTCPGVTIANGFAGSQVYQCTLEDLLVSAKLIPAGYISKLPGNPNYSTVSGGGLSLMLYQCGPAANDTYAIYWALKNPTSNDTTGINNTLNTCANSVSIRDSWGMRAGKIIQL